jgi:crotonobetainyl-CoA:carnitine CoA-transferase CaiB-like acyl-CoA transferase
MAGALDGIRVIDFGQWIAGPLSALLLADQGAEVIHVDPPGGRPGRQRLTRP